MANFIAGHWVALTLFFTPSILGILIVRGRGSPGLEAPDRAEEINAHAAPAPQS